MIRWWRWRETRGTTKRKLRAQPTMGYSENGNAGIDTIAKWLVKSKFLFRKWVHIMNWSIYVRYAKNQGSIKIHRRGKKKWARVVVLRCFFFCLTHQPPKFRVSKRIVWLDVERGTWHEYEKHQKFKPTLNVIFGIFFLLFVSRGSAAKMKIRIYTLRNPWNVIMQFFSFIFYSPFSF